MRSSQNNYITEQINEATKALNYKQFDKVINICENIIKKNKNLSKVYNIWGLALQAKNLFNESILNFNKAIKINPNNFEAFNNLAISLKSIKNFDLAEEMYLRSLKINPNFLKGLVNLAKLKIETKYYNEAIKLLLRAIKVSPIEYKVLILSMLIKAHSIIGNTYQVELNAEEILKIDEYNIYAIITISDLFDHKLSLKMIRKMENIINSSNITNEGIISLAFALGRAYEKREIFSKAYEYFELGNKLKKKIAKSFTAQLNVMKNELIDCFSNINLINLNKNFEDNKVIFIIGLPRSGTTLIEQIISSHPNVESGGEIQILKHIVNENFITENKLDKNILYESMNFNSNLVQKKYFENLFKNNIKSKILTDKSIENFLYIGFIKIFFPNSKIVIVKRRKEDVFLSIFQTDFSAQFLGWSYDKKEIIEYMKIYSELIDFWQKLFPEGLYTLEYEKLLNNSENQIRNLISYCDLDWDPKCLKPEKNLSGVETASLYQVRKPMYKSSINKSKNYSTYLKDFFNLLK